MTDSIGSHVQTHRRAFIENESGWPTHRPTQTHRPTDLQTYRPKEEEEDEDFRLASKT